MDEQLQDLIDELRELNPTLRSMTGTRATDTGAGNNGTDKLIQAIARLSSTLDKSNKTVQQRDRAVKKFTDEVEKGSKQVEYQRKATQLQTKAADDAAKAERERIRRASLTQDARDREDAAAATRRQSQLNRDQAETLKRQKYLRTGAAELADEYIKGLNASRMFNSRLEDMAGESVSAQIAARGLAHTISTTSKTLKELGGSVGNFGKEVASGNKSFELLNPLIDSVANGLAELADAIPLAGGVLSASVRLVAEGSKFVLGQLQQASEAFNNLGRVGALTAEGMTGVYRGFLESGMQLPAFTRMIEQNSLQLARFSGTVGEGRDKLTNFLGTIVDSRAGDELRRIGFSTDQIGETAAAFTAQQTRLGLAQRKTQAQLALESTEYAKQIDLLARLTGQQREDIVQQQDAALSEGRFRATTDRLIAQGNENSARALLNFQNQVNAVSPELGMAIRDIASGFVNSEAAIKGFNSSGGAIIGIVDQLKNGQISTSAALERLQDATQSAEERQRTFAQAVGDGQDVFVQYSQISDFNRAAVEGSVLKAKTAQDTAISGQDQLTDSTVEAQRNMEQLGRQLNNFGFQVMPQAATAVSMFTGALNEFVNYVSDELGIALPNVTQHLEDATAGVQPAAGDTTVPARPEVTATAGHDRRNQINRQRAWDLRYGANYNADGTPKQVETVPVAPGDVPSRPGTQQAPVRPYIPDPLGGTGASGQIPNLFPDQSTVSPPTTSSVSPPLAPPAAPGTAPSNQQSSVTRTPAMPSGGEFNENFTMLTEAFQNQGFGNEMVAASLANVMKESGGISRSENMNYSSIARIREVFGGNTTAAGGKVRDLSDRDLAPLVRNPQALANFMYGHRMGNEGEGYKFRGRGFIQLTGKNNYSAASEAIFGDDRLVQNPDLAAQPKVASQISAWFMKTNAERIGSQMGVDPTGSMSQANANRLATSTIAGRLLTPGQSFAGSEGLGKVQGYVQQILPMLANAESGDVPHARYGGILRGPDSGYAAQLHGSEAVVPLPDGKTIPVSFGAQMGAQNFGNFAAPVNNFSSPLPDSSLNQQDSNGEQIKMLENVLNDLKNEFTNLKDVLQSKDGVLSEAVGELVNLQRSSNSTQSRMLMNSQG